MRLSSIRNANSCQPNEDLTPNPLHSESIRIKALFLARAIPTPGTSVLPSLFRCWGAAMLLQVLAQCLADDSGIAENLRYVGFKQHDVAASDSASVVFAPNRVSQIRFWNVAFINVSVIAHIDAARSSSQGEPR